MIIGKPLDFSRYEGMAEDRFVLRSVTDEIMYELMRLSGQEYVDVYAATMKERLAAARRRPAPRDRRRRPLDGRAAARPETPPPRARATSADDASGLCAAAGRSPVVRERRRGWDERRLRRAADVFRVAALFYAAVLHVIACDE